MQKVAWAPQEGPQALLAKCPVYEIFYGGARGGGKTDGVLGKMGNKALRYGKRFNCVFFRRELPMLDDAIERSIEIYGKLGAKWKDRQKMHVFPGGGRLRFRPLERVADAEKYQGQNLTDVCIEEAGNYPDKAPIMRLHGALRSAHGVPAQMHLTGNPGGPGQGWLKERYVDPAPKGFKVLSETFKWGGKDHTRQRVYIPSRVHDNPMLLRNDPNYIANLYMVGSTALVEAWLDGSWDAIEGQFFDGFSREKHVIPDMNLPHWWVRFRAFDWGYAAPFSVGWYAVSDGEPLKHEGRAIDIPRGALVKYREWYGANASNEGARLANDQIAKGILVREAEEISYSVADPSIFSVSGGPSIAEQMAKEGVLWRKADNRRIAKAGPLSGWDQVRRRLADRQLLFMESCVHTIRTFPQQQHSAINPEDLDTSGEDHAVDETRYACMSRPYFRELEEKGDEFTFDRALLTVSEPARARGF